MKFSKLYKEIVLDDSFNNWKKLFIYYMQVNKAHTLMLKKAQIVSEDILVQIAQALRKIEEEQISGDLPEQVEDLVFLVERRMAELIGVEKAGFLHTARSRNDVDATVFRMCVREELMSFCRYMVTLVEALIQKAESSTETLTLLYTHGQPAQVSTFAHYLLSFVFDLIETLDALFQSLHTVNLCPMGSGAITTTGFPIDRKLVSDYLGFSKPVENSYRAIVTSHWIMTPASAMKILMSDLTRLVQDFIHKSSCEVGILQFPDDLVQISSIMPQKRNPVVLEHIRIRANIANGIFNAVEQSFVNTAYHDVNENGDFVLFKFLEAVKIAKEALQLAQEVFEKVKVDENRVKDLALKTGATTTELADELVRRFGISFRQSHSLVSDYVKAQMKYGVIKEKFEQLFGMRFDLTEKQVNEILSSENFVQVRKVLGGPHKDRVLEMIKQAQMRAKDINEKLLSLSEQVSLSLTRLEKDFDELLQPK
ncbi:MAG: argininosuccinate lyase [Pseudothermotoga sp.]